MFMEVSNNLNLKKVSSRCVRCQRVFHLRIRILCKSKDPKFPPARFARRLGFGKDSAFAASQIPGFPPARFARRRGFTKVPQRILPLRQAKHPKFRPARFARRRGFIKVPLRILPLRQAQYIKSSPARFARRRGFVQGFKKF